MSRQERGAEEKTKSVAKTDVRLAEPPSEYVELLAEGSVFQGRFAARAATQVSGDV